MKAAWYTQFGPAEEVLSMGELPDPVPGPGEVRVKLAASGINPSDVKSRAGSSRPLAGPLVVPHSDGAGTIDQVGPGVDAALVGTRVWTYNAAYRRAFGTAAEYVVLPRALAAPLPDALDFAQGACLGVPAMTAHRCLFGQGAQGSIAGKTVLVSGGGGAVGNIAIQLAAWAGARVFATAGSAESMAHAQAAGAEAVVHYKERGAAEKIGALTGGVDLVVEVDLAANALASPPYLRPGATVASYASVTDREPRIPFSQWTAKNIRLHCVLVYESTPAEFAQAITDIYAWGGSPFARVAIAAALPLDKIVQAHRLVEKGGKQGQVVLTL
ncbi:MAG: NADPH:quinone reductase [Pseudomonadota bacterium]